MNMKLVMEMLGYIGTVFALSIYSKCIDVMYNVLNRSLSGGNFGYRINFKWHGIMGFTDLNKCNMHFI